ncbi:S-adenosylmethionine:tRNA ribosyltransferase-isomerase [Halobacillus sp. BBL2006]|uniref:S-adenosylmethionine:tRNA ribosyltransferase-isomerase n=1 Tax=Halobacillus sp. BBL2006 TaxID=1543706 RepID=UPI0005435321|nr:S-adenosylmethionine:tRNA ribosyltransferase-isomerase [Halobacillus sp. BBL2006]KHE69861.1 S-adenosylmethionine tRNA ribosyltransferase [Halobacillus sp. BBL2006]
MSNLPERFQVPDNLNAVSPAEYEGGSRDQVRMMVLDQSLPKPLHNQFNQIGQYLNPGDILVLNNSRTIPPVLKGKQGKNPVEVRLSREISTNQWEALVLGPLTQANAAIILPDEMKAYITGTGSEHPLVTLTFSESGRSLLDFLYRYGEPVRYEYIDQPWPLDAYQTVYGSLPGSVEMASAGRAFTWKLLNSLKAKGIKLAFIQLHTGLSYYEKNRWPDPRNHPENYRVPEDTVKMIQSVKSEGNRVIAVGTTVVRALESSVNCNGELVAHSGVTTLYVDHHHKHSVVDGLLTGFHEPEASHLDMLASFLPESTLMNGYNEAIQKGYLWHEFGDMNLLLPSRKRT